MRHIGEYKAGYKIKRNIKKGSGVIKSGRIFERKKIYFTENYQKVQFIK